MKRFAISSLAVAALALSACASLAPYGAQQGPSGQGFSEQRIESNRYRVTYRGVGAPGPVAIPPAQMRVVNAFDGASFLSEALASTAGEQVFMNYVRANAGAIKGAIG